MHMYARVVSLFWIGDGSPWYLATSPSWWSRVSTFAPHICKYRCTCMIELLIFFGAGMAAYSISQRPFCGDHVFDIYIYTCRERDRQIDRYTYVERKRKSENERERESNRCTCTHIQTHIYMKV